jgi:hypothetical protein
VVAAVVTLPPWLVGLVIVYMVALTAIFSYLFMEQVQRKRRKARKPQCTNDPWCGYRKNPLCSACRPAVRRPRTKVVDLHSSSDAAIRAVAQEGLDAAPELADDGEAVARTVLALEKVAELRRLARADGEAAAFVSPGHRRLDAFLDELLDRRRR